MKEEKALFEKLFRLDGDIIVSSGEHEKIERKIKAIKAEIKTHHKRDDPEASAWYTVELIERIISDEYFTDVSQNSLRSEA